MPPTKHSSSSHSSSGRSSSSRSSSSSSRSYSSRSSSSSSRSSYSRSSPSSHSSSSRSSAGLSYPGRSPYSKIPNRPSAPPSPNRPRVNQPVGFVSTDGARPRHIYGSRHEYIYYPVAWTDSGTGTYYEKGYYDESGQRYDDVSFEKDGKYENVVCHCPYCGQDSLLTLDADKAAAQSLQCPYCGAPMEIRSLLDKALSSSEQTVSDQPAPNTSVYPPYQAPKKTKKRRGWLITLIVLAVLYVMGKFGAGTKEAGQTLVQSDPVQQVGSVYSAPDTVYDDEVLYLVRSGENSCVLTGSAEEADRQLVWDADADSYYDEASECWLWYNTDVDPAVWQYWYEGISSDFGDCGWMEHDDDGWFIEASPGNWIALPSGYDTSSLWYLTD